MSELRIIQILLLIAMSSAGSDGCFPTGFSAAKGALLSAEEEARQEEEKEEEDEEELSPPAARQNTILRSYFRSQYLQLRGERYDLNETFMERYVDRQIDSFLRDIDSRLERLTYWLEQAEQAHSRWAASNDPGSEREERIRLTKALKEVDDSAGSIRGRLMNIFLSLDTKEQSPVEVQPSDGFESEMLFLKEQVEDAENRIREYLFQTTNVVSYQDLKGDNMIIRLYWAEKTADRIRDLLRR